MKLLTTLLLLTNISCTTTSDFRKTVDKVEINKFMKKWYVIAGRVTMMENGAHNSVEEYTWNKDEERIDVNFYYNKDSFDGKIKKIPQKAWIEDNQTNAYWSVSPFWPLKFDYLIIDLAPDYSWTVVGVPSQKWVWIMAQDWSMDDDTLATIIQRIKKLGYNTDEIIRIPQKW